MERVFSRFINKFMTLALTSIHSFLQRCRPDVMPVVHATELQAKKHKQAIT